MRTATYSDYSLLLGDFGCMRYDGQANGMCEVNESGPCQFSTSDGLMQATLIGVVVNEQEACELRARGRESSK